MLGMIGFLTLACVVSIYAYTCHVHYTLVPLRERQLFTAAYGLLGLTAVVWATTFLVVEAAVPALVFTSDIMLVVATACILGVVLDITKPTVYIPLILVGSGLLTARAFVFPPTAYISDGLLFFNLSQLQALVIGLIFLIAWLPATIKVAYLALRSPRLLPFRNLVSFLFTAVVLMTGFFLAARRPIMIVITFVSIILLFAILSGVNIALERFDKAHGKKQVRHG